MCELSHRLLVCLTASRVESGLMLYRLLARRVGSWRDVVQVASLLERSIGSWLVMVEALM